MPASGQCGIPSRIDYNEESGSCGNFFRKTLFPVSKASVAHLKLLIL